MEITDIYSRVGGWMDNSGPLSDVVISSRIRLARNVAGFVFYAHADEQERSEVLKRVHDRLMSSALQRDLWYVEMDAISPLECQMLSERHMISRKMMDGEGSRGLALSHDETLSLMINEEDHLRLQVLASGLQLTELYERINRVDDILEENLEFAFSPQYGYLTACPTNVGTGIRVSVMLHLPGLNVAGQIEKVFRAARDMHLAVRGLYGEGTEPVGDLYQLSNQTTLGQSEGEIIEAFVRQAVEPMVEYERLAREKLLADNRAMLEDKIFRAWGILQNARMISSDETLYLLSFARLGVHLGLIDRIDVNSINEMLLLTKPAHLQNLCQKKLEPAERDIRRAEYIRKQLA